MSQKQLHSLVSRRAHLHRIQGPGTDIQPPHWNKRFNFCGDFGVPLQEHLYYTLRPGRED